MNGNKLLKSLLSLLHTVLFRVLANPKGITKDYGVHNERERGGGGRMTERLRADKRERFGSIRSNEREREREREQ